MSCVEGGDVDIVSVSEEKKNADKKTNLEEFKARVKELWDVQVTDEVARVLMDLHTKMDLDLVKSVLDVADALNALKPKGNEDLDELDETATPIEPALESQTEEIKKVMEKIIDEVVDKVVRAVRATFKDIKENEEDDLTDLDIEEDPEDDDLENDETENGETEDEADIEEDEIAAVVSDSLKEVLGRLD